MGWQKLWVVFTNFCLFFYKTFQVSSWLFKNYPFLGDKDVTSIDLTQMSKVWAYLSVYVVSVEFHDLQTSLYVIAYDLDRSLMTELTCILGQAHHYDCRFIFPATKSDAESCLCFIQTEFPSHHYDRYAINRIEWRTLTSLLCASCMICTSSTQDDFPLASLPLLGYVITTPGEDDQIQKEFVFKLQFKNHVYFFR